MKNADVFLQFQRLNKKYENIGLTIDIDFNRFGMVFRGYWALKGQIELINFNRIYDYYRIKNLSENIDIEFLIDEFKEEFEHKLKNEQKEE